MTYYPTIEEDLARAKEILAKGKPMFSCAHSFDETCAACDGSDLGGTIYAADIDAAYKLLESFVAHIEMLDRNCVDKDQRINELEHAVMNYQQQLRDELRENSVLRGLLAAANIPCVYCGLTDISRCKAGFPGCARADDLLAGQDEAFRAAVFRAHDWQKLAQERSARIIELEAQRIERHNE